MFGRADALGIAGADDEAFFPFGEGEDGEVVVGEVAAEVGEIEVTSGGVLEMGAGDVDFALVEPFESELGGSGRGKDLDVGGAFGEAAEKSGGGIAAGDDEALLEGVVGVEERELARGGEESVGVGQIVGRGGSGDGDPAIVKSGDANGLGGRSRRGGEDLGRDGGGRRRGSGFIEREELLDGDAEFAREAEGEFGVGGVLSGFESVDGLAGDAGAAGEVGGGDVALLAKGGELVAERHRGVGIRSVV